MCWCWYEEQDSYFFRGGVSRFKDTDGRYESGRRMPSWKISFVLKTLNQFDKKKIKKSFRTFIKKALLLLLRSLHIHALDRRRRKKILAERSHSRTGECWGRGRCNDTTVRRRTFLFFFFDIVVICRRVSKGENHRLWCSFVLFKKGHVTFEGGGHKGVHSKLAAR